jgi:CO/xanthine dehydrogenase FAD-binding subunit
VSAAAQEEQNVVIPRSPDEAVASFGDGSGVTVLAGGTILMPELTARRIRPDRVLLLARAGLDTITREDGKVRIGAGVSIAALTDGDEPLATAAKHVADPEIRAQATVGGNLCAAAGRDTPRGDLQAPLIALDAQVRSAGAGGERVESVEEFLANPEGRLVLDVSYADASRSTGYAALARPHAHHYTILAVAAARVDGELRLAATGVGPHAVRLRSVEASGNADDVLQDVDPEDDALASAWYRKRVLPGLVAQALSELG